MPFDLPLSAHFPTYRTNRSVAGARNAIFVETPASRLPLQDMDPEFSSSTKFECPACLTLYWLKNGREEERIAPICATCSQRVLQKPYVEERKSMLVCKAYENLDQFLYLVYNDEPAPHVDKLQLLQAVYGS